MNLARNPQALWAAAAVVALALADQAIAALLGSQPLFPAFASGSAGLLAFGLGHCDGLDGPVVTRAREALERGNVNLVLPWVREQDEEEIRRAFQQAREVRELGPRARTLADRHFFETLVRVHRAGEGAPFAGLKSAGRDLGPAVPAADRALEDGSVDKVVSLLAEAVGQGVRRHFHAARRRRAFDANDVVAGREFVAAYVSYIHYVEHLWQAAAGAPQGHHAAREHAVHEH